MLSKAIKFASVLKNGDKPATLGLNYYFDRDIPAHTELRKSDIYASRYYDMIRLQKKYLKTWNNVSVSSYPPSNLDHCYASKHLKLEKFSNKLLINSFQHQGSMIMPDWCQSFC